VRPSGDKWRPSIGKVGEWYVESWDLQGCSPCLCRLRTDVLAPTSKYWMYRVHVDDMHPVSLVAFYRQMFGFLHYFIGWLRRESRYGPTDQTDIMLRIVSGTLFLRSSDSVQLCERLMNGCYALTTWDTYGCDHTPTEWMRVVCRSGFSLQGVHWFKSLRLSDMSNRLFRGSLHIIN
jgi:hypothetical protein